MRAKIRGCGQTRRHGAVLDVIRILKKKISPRSRDCEGTGILVWSSMDTSPRIMIGKDIERSMVSEATKVSNAEE